MAISVSFISQPSNLAVRCNKAVLSGTNVILPTWDRHSAYALKTSNNTLSALNLGTNDTSATYLAASNAGYISAASDSSGNVYALSNDFLLGYHSGSGVSVKVAYACSPDGKIPVQIVWDGSALLVETADGEVYTASAIGGPGALTYTSLGTFPAYAARASYYNGNTYGVVGSTSQMSRMSSADGTVTNVTAPMTVPTEVSPSTYGDAVLGFSYVDVTTPYIEILPFPTSATTLAIGLRYSSTTFDVLSGNDAGYSVQSSVTAASSPVDAVWQSNAEQLLITLSSGAVGIYGNNEEVLSLSQTLTVANAKNIAISIDNSQALVSQTSSNQITVLNNALNVWSIASTVTGLASPGKIVTISSSQMAVCVTDGVAILSESGGVWTIQETIALSYTPTYLAYESISDNIYVCGSASGTAYYGTLNPTFVYTSGDSWTGAAASLKCIGNRVVLLDTTNNTVRQYPSASAAPAAEVIVNALPVSATAYLSVATDNVWLTTTSQSYSMNFYGVDGALKRNRFGVVSVYNETSSAWSSYTLAAEVTPTACAWDASGNLWVVSSDNKLYQFTSTLGVTTTTALGEYTGQEMGVTLGVSSIVFYNNVLYMTTSLSGVVIVVTGV